MKSATIIALSISLTFLSGCGLVTRGGNTLSGNIRYDRIQRVAAGGKLIFKREEWRDDGMAVQVEPGVSGGELAIGYGGGWIGFGAASYFLKASILRTWGDPPVGIEPNQTYVGLGVEGSFAGTYATLAVYRHVSGNDDEHPVIVSFGVGVGF